MDISVLIGRALRVIKQLQGKKTGNGESEEIEGAARDGYLLFPIREPRRIESKSDGVGVGTQPLDFSDISM